MIRHRNLFLPLLAACCLGLVLAVCRPSPALAGLDVFDAVDLARRGQQALADGDPALAESLTSQALEAKVMDRVDQAVTFKVRGVARQRLGRLREALADYSEALALAPEYVEALHNRGAAWLEAGDAQAALADLDKAVELRPGWDLALYNRGRARTAAGNPAGAVQDFTAVLEANPVNPLGWWRRGQALAAMGRVAAAEADFGKAVELAPDTVEPLLDRGRLRLQQGDVAAAVRDFNAAVAVAPKEPRARFDLALALQAMDDLPGAEAAWSRVIALSPPPAVLSDAYNNRGVVREQSGDREAAVEDFTRALALTPTRALPYANRGRALLALGRADEAAADLGRAIALSPPMAALHRARGEAYLALGKADSAAADFTAALQLEPDDASLRLVRGRARYMAARWALADDDLSAWLNGPSPQDAEARRMRGLARYMAGRFPAAVRDFRSLVRLRPPTGGNPDWNARLWLRLARLRSGADTKPLPADVCRGEAPGGVSLDTWPCPLVRFHQGGMSVQALMAAAGDDPARVCAAALHAGTAALVAGDRVRAVRLFKDALATGRRDLPEAKAAASELSRLGF